MMARAAHKVRPYRATVYGACIGTVLGAVVGLAVFFVGYRHDEWLRVLWTDLHSPWVPCYAVACITFTGGLAAVAGAIIGAAMSIVAKVRELASRLDFSAPSQRR
ncbi:MAG TPA: hypothetical protein VFA18_13155 [Gemmataceae bacterium]|nr:hypothetical protein [Gemmataceae bacterium]